eukprot:scaffold596272_cov18-Prasinocladus_malaysianus.AAC.1
MAWSFQNIYPLKKNNTQAANGIQCQITLYNFIDVYESITQLPELAWQEVYDTMRITMYQLASND